MAEAVGKGAVYVEEVLLHIGLASVVSVLTFELLKIAGLSTVGIVAADRQGGVSDTIAAGWLDSVSSIVAPCQDFLPLPLVLAPPADCGQFLA